MKSFVISQVKFFFRTLANYRRVGAVMPSSRFLARAMCKQVDWDNCQTILELGPGTGVFTKEIVKRMQPSTKLILLERDPVFVEHLKEEFTQATIIQGDVKDLGEILRTQNVDSLDAVISGLPVLFIPDKILTPFYQALNDVLSAESKFLQFTYHAKNFRKLTTAYMDKVEVKRYILLNVPPACVLQLTLKKQAKP